jgi:hypothetical protein
MYPKDTAREFYEYLRDVVVPVEGRPKAQEPGDPVSLTEFSPDFGGLLSAVVCDLNGDGQPEMLTVCGAGFSIKFDYKKGDKVLLLGLKDYIKKAQDVTSATETTSYFHYTRETLKAIPLCVFSDDAKVKVEVEDGTLKITTEQNIELNGNDKQFVTWSELNQALQDLWTAIQGHTHPVSTTGTAAAQSGTAATSLDLSTVTLDISAAKTKTILTGG